MNSTRICKARGVIALAGTTLLMSALLSGCGSKLARAVDAGDTVAVKKALDNGEDANQRSMSGLPAHQAIRNNDIAMLRLLHERGARLLPTYLVTAAEHGSRDVYSYLLENGVSASTCGVTPTLTPWPSTHPENNLFGTMPPIGVAIARRDLVSVTDFVNSGSPLNVPCGKQDTFSSILAAAVVGDPNIMKYLLAHGAEPNTLRNDGLTPLAIAAQQGHYEVARLLLANGAFHTYSQAAKQPIELAIKDKHQDIVELLRYAGAVPPYRPAMSDRLEKWSNTAIGGAVLVGSLWLLYEGVKYAGYEDVSGVLNSGNRDSWSSPPVKQKTATICRSDYDCAGNLRVCLKKPNRSDGVCVRDASGVGDSPDSYGPRMHPPLGSLEETTCPTGFRFDYIYRACVN